MTVLAEFPHPDTRFDLCVVGSGPVGLALALQAAARGLQVLVLEAGPRQAADAPAPPSATLIDPARHAPAELATHRALGGTSWLWGGRCVPFDAIDFEAREYVPYSGWPIGLQDVLPWYASAADYLDFGSDDFNAPSPGWPGLRNVRMDRVERWARQPRLAARLGARALATPNVHVLFDAPVAELEFAADNRRLDALLLSHAGQKHRLIAPRYALACGGLETTRLLLVSQRTHPAMFGGPDGALGRFYMGHLFGSIADIVLTQPNDFDILDFHRDGTGAYSRRRFSFPEDVQRRERLLNTSFFADNPAFHDESHRNGTLSAVFLALSIPTIGRKLLSEAIRLKHIGPAPRAYAGHLLNIVRNPFRAAGDVVDILKLRYLSSVRKPGFVLKNEGGTYSLSYHAEQVPDPDSRVQLNHDGSLVIDFRYQATDVDSVLRAHALLDADLRASRRGHVAYRQSPERCADSVLRQASDGFHQVGTTRMSASPRDGVVDADCKVHGVDNLYIASSSVFATTGEANPTVLAVALAARLAAHLAQPAASGAASLPLPKATMQRIQIPGTDLQVSRLSFGTASLHHLLRDEQRRDLLAAALAAGFTHFDTSPMYGFGLGEVQLGLLPASDRARITVATKVGLYGPRGAGASTAQVIARKLLGKALPALNRAVVDWSVATARASVERSLRRLQRDSIDLLYLHEPDAALIQSEEWLRLLEELRQSGKIRHWGIAGEAERIGAMLQSHAALAQVVQVRDSLDQHQADVLLPHARPMQFTYGYLAAQSAHTGNDPGAVLRGALQRNPGGSILVSTRRVDRVDALAAAVG